MDTRLRCRRAAELVQERPACEPLFGQKVSDELDGRGGQLLFAWRCNPLKPPVCAELCGCRHSWDDAGLLHEMGKQPSDRGDMEAVPQLAAPSVLEELRLLPTDL